MGIRDYLAYAAKQYGTNAGVLDNVARLESGYNATSVNNWDSNAQAGTPSKGLMQFIEPTYAAFSKQARAANPNAWKNVNDTWLDPRAQALTASWAIANGKGNQWSTYGRAQASAPSYNYTPKYRLGTGATPTTTGAAPVTPTTPIKPVPQIPMMSARPFTMTNEQQRQFAYTGQDAASLIQATNERRSQEALDFNTNARTSNANIAGQIAHITPKPVMGQVAPIGAVPVNAGTSQALSAIAAVGNKGGQTYQQILGLGEHTFGLRLDAGNGQTTGGSHADGSYHYSGRAVDFGDAKNS